MQLSKFKKRCLERKQKPFLKWAGGKSQLLATILKHIPNKYNKYIEPFVGGGALLFALEPKQAVINDLNEELMNCYSIVKKNVNSLIKDLYKHKNDKEYYYQIRAQNVSKLTKIERASRFIYLNRTCYNGLWRVNKKNQFNTPYGKYKNPNIIDINVLVKTSRYLEQVEIHSEDYYNFLLRKSKKDDFIYLDPPYYPISRYSDFKRYTKEGFDFKQQKRLAKLFGILNRRGCKLLLSNSYAKCIVDLYTDYKIDIVKAKRIINSDHHKRGYVKEILVKNYE